MEIEQGIPLPIKRRGAPNARTLIIDTIMQMKPGDSVLFATEKEASNFRSTAVIYVRRGKLNPSFRFTQRKVDGGTRVWLVEDKNEPKTSTTSAT